MIGAFCLGIFIGVAVGVITMSILAMARDRDDNGPDSAGG